MFDAAGSGGPQASRRPRVGGDRSIAAVQQDTGGGDGSARGGGGGGGHDSDEEERRLAEFGAWLEQEVPPS